MGQAAGAQSKQQENGHVSLLNGSKAGTSGEVYLEIVSQDAVKLYRRRWLMLFLFCAYSFSNAYQWIHLNIIASVLVGYYNTSLPSDTYERDTTIDWLSMVYMLAYVPLIFPATWLLDKKGLKLVCVLGAFLNIAGAWIKCAAVSPGRFPVLMFAQVLCAISQIFVLGIPPRLAAVWFGPNEVSTATSIGVFGNQVGVAVGFLLPPIMVPNSNDPDEVGRNFGIMLYTTAGFTTLVFLLILIVFQKAPPLPPSRAQMLAVQAAASEHYGRSLLRLLKNRGFLLLMLTYGLNTGSFYAISTLLNAVFLHYFPHDELNAGRVGLTLVLLGVLGSIVGGFWLDRTKTFKATSVVIYFLSMAAMVAYTFTFDFKELWVVYLTAGSLGFFMTGYLPVGFEFAAEITYPESEGTSSGLINFSAQIVGIALTLGMRGIMTRFNVLSANIAVSVALLVGTVVTALIKPDYRRQAAEREHLPPADLKPEPPQNGSLFVARL